MKLHQLRYLVEIVAQNQNISRAAESLCTSQSGISKQIKLLEEELHLSLFQRRGKNLIGLTAAGQEIHQAAMRLLKNAENIMQIAREHNGHSGALVVATTHTQARYVLPYVVERFIRQYPEVHLHLQQGNPNQIARFLIDGKADIAIATEALEQCEELITMPCYRWSRSIIVRQDHPLCRLQGMTLQEIAKYPIVTYALGFTGRYKVDEAFAAQGLRPNIVLTAVDADVIKTYVRLGLGVGIIANMALNAGADGDLQAMPAKHLFGVSTTHIAFKKDLYIRKSLFRFIEMFAPHLTERVIEQAIACNGDAGSRKKLFQGITLPVY